MNTTTISDTDGTVLTLDEAVVEALEKRHAVHPFGDGWWLSPPGKTAWLLDATVIALVIDVLKTLVREVHCDAHAMPRFTDVGDTVWAVWRLDPTGGHTLAPYHPTELQAWHAAWGQVVVEATP